MTKAIPQPIVPATPAAPLPALENAAVLRCCAAYERAVEACRAQNLDFFQTEDKAGKAYCEAMPHLSGRENISDFVASIAHGLLLGAISSYSAPKLLYAAQVASGVLRTSPKSQ